MNSDYQQTNGEWSAMGGWMKSAMDLWFSAANAWSGQDSSRACSDSTTGVDFKTRFQEAWQKPFEAFQTLFSTFGDTEGFDSFTKGIGAVPDLMMKMLRSGYDSYSQLHRQWLEKIATSCESGESFSFANLDEDMLKAWMEFYQKEIQPILNVPQLGLNRFYQEKMYQAIDKYSMYQVALSEFLRMLSLPIEESRCVMLKEIERLGEEGKLSENFKDYYLMWIKALESRYSTMFRSSTYLESLERMLSTLGDFKMAQRKILEDALQRLPIPTNKDMDELYKELYLLKKKVQQLTSKEESLEFSLS